MSQITPEFARWLCTNLMGTQRALVRHGRVRDTALDACIAQAEREYDAELLKKQQASAFDFQEIISKLPFPVPQVLDMGAGTITPERTEDAQHRDVDGRGDEPPH